MKSRSDVWLRALEDLGAQCSVSTQRSAVTFADRVKKEGDSFIKITLPQFARDLEEALDLGAITPDMFRGFRRSARHVSFYEHESSTVPALTVRTTGGTPSFLGEFLDLIFMEHEHVTVGTLDLTAPLMEQIEEVLEFPASMCLCTLRVFETREERMLAGKAVRAVRQLCLMFSKERDLCSEGNIQKALNAFVATDQELIRPLRTIGPTSFSQAEGSTAFVE